jgi:hypothetical protein
MMGTERTKVRTARGDGANRQILSETHESAQDRHLERGSTDPAKSRTAWARSFSNLSIREDRQQRALTLRATEPYVRAAQTATVWNVERFKDEHLRSIIQTAVD